MLINEILRAAEDSAAHLIYPYRCPLCDRVMDKHMGLAHASCRMELIPVKEPACVKCGKPLVNPREEYCPDCSKKKLSYKRARALWVYKGRIRGSLYRFKYSNRREYGEFYGKEAVARYGSWMKKMEIEAIIPVPVHKKRLAARGYNQAELIARWISQMTGIELRTDLLERVRHTKAQKALNDRQRKNNLKNAFQFRGNRVQLKHVLLVDDIYTTGSTVDAVAEVLGAAGIEEVFVLCLCIGELY